ncbi:MAG: hypothetical protein AAF907_15080 [Planctomycetota bacterium]
MKTSLRPFLAVLPLRLRALLFLLSAATAQTGFAQSFTERFDALDVNRDGEVTAAETLNAGWYGRLLDRFDQNGDGVLQRREISAADARFGRKSADESHLSQPPQPAFQAVRDVAYDRIDGVEEKLLSYNVYFPEGDPPADGRPVIVMIHGGGWRGGDKANRSMAGAKRDHFVGRDYVYISIEI